MATRFTDPFPRFFTDNLAALSGGKLFFFEDDGGTTKKDTFSDNALSVANANPVILSSSGVIPDIFLDGTYRVVLQNSSGVQIDAADNVNAGSSGFVSWETWDSGFDYPSGPATIVTASDGKYYKSILTPNLGNNPISSPTFWSFIDLDVGTLTATSTITGDTVEATGDTAAGDNAAMGHTATEGLILTGQGSITDWVIKNDADQDVISCATGTQVADFAVGLSFGDETLGEYDEGVWTPVLSDGSNNATSAASTYGRYTRVGNIVHINCRMITTSLGSVSGDLRISGLPFTASDTSIKVSVITGGLATGLAITASTNVVGTIQGGSTFMLLQLWDATTGNTVLQESEWTADGGCYFSGVYEI